MVIFSIISAWNYQNINLIKNRIMTLFKHKKTGILYVACVLVKDIHFTNNNECSGIYFEPYNTRGNETITHLKSGDYPYNPDEFISDNFIKVATL